MSEYTPNLNLFKYNTSTDGKEVFSINQALNYNWDILDNLGSGRNIGEIVASTIPLTDAGLHLLDGALIQGGGIYSDFVDYIAGLVSTYPSVFTTESAWQTAVTTYGVCGKFVYDSVNNTVRLPKITGMIEGTVDVNALGDLVEAGLPNITGMAEGFKRNGISAISPSTGALTNTENYRSDNYQSSTTSNETGRIIFDASLSNPIYSNSSTVQPQTIKAFYYIVVATSVKTDIQVDIDEIATDLNNKVDKADLEEVQCVVETYKNGTSWYRVYSDGWCEQGFCPASSSTSTFSSVTLLKPFKDTNYSVFITGYNGSYYPRFNSKTTTSFTLDSSQRICWQACGYIEV